MKAQAIVTPERELLREMRGRNRKLMPRLVRAGSPERLYPVIRDHQAIAAIQEWVVAVDQLHRANHGGEELVTRGDADTDADDRASRVCAGGRQPVSGWRFQKQQKSEGGTRPGKFQPRA